MLPFDLNCDLGEGYPSDTDLMPLITSANIACGYHAGDRDTMRRTVDLALEHGVAVGAHPGFADRENFGRRELRLSGQEYYDLVLEQVQIMADIARAAGTTLRHIKPHGALYNMAARDPELAYTLARAVRDFDPQLLLFGLSGSSSIAEAKKLGLRTISEVFADRSYQPDGSLTPRSQPGALLENEVDCQRQVYEMVVHGQVKTADGPVISICAETICLHGDGVHAVEFARMLRRFLEKIDGQRQP
ncbi:MAG: 5-oxoprolinase subunit PxpA [Saprospiraceae bacterium]